MHGTRSNEDGLLSFAVVSFGEHLAARNWSLINVLAKEIVLSLRGYFGAPLRLSMQAC